MSNIFVLFRNKKVVAVATTRPKVEELLSESQLAEGCIKNVNFRIVEVQEYEYINNL